MPEVKWREIQRWRVGWVETPERRNCLNVHDLQYTHMFETILSSTSGGGDDDDGLLLYFGHLYLPGGHRRHYRGRNVIVSKHGERSSWM